MYPILHDISEAVQHGRELAPIFKRVTEVAEDIPPYKVYYYRQEDLIAVIDHAAQILKEMWAMEPALAAGHDPLQRELFRQPTPGPETPQG